MSANPRSTEHALFLLAAAAAVSGVAAPGDLAANLWRFGGGSMAVLWLAALLLVALPLVVLELALCARAGQSLPAALRERRGPWAEWLGWLLLAQAGLLSALLLTRAAWALTPTGLAPLVVAGLGLIALLVCARPRLGGVLGGLAIGAALVGAAVAFSGADAGMDAVLSLFVPRWEALLNPQPWASSAGSALRSAPAALAVLPALLEGLPARSRPAGLGLRAALLGALVALVAAAGAFCVMISASAPPPASAPVGVALAGVPLGPMALGGALASGALAAAVGRAMVHAGRERWGSAEVPAAMGLSLIALAAGLATVGAPGVAAAEIAVTWLVGLLGPALALALCLALRAPDGLVELTRALDRAGGVRITRWLPTATRWLTPTVLLVSLTGSLATLWANGLPGRELADALGPLGPLTGALHTVVPGLTLTLLFALSTGLCWLPRRGEEGAP